MGKEPDPDALLEHGLAAARDWEEASPGSAAERAAAETATGALAGLNVLAGRGVLPARWRDAIGYADAR